MIPQVSYPRWTVRMCLWIPAAVLKTFPQFFHKHLNITFMEFCQGHRCTVSTLIHINLQTTCTQHSDAHKRLTRGGCKGWERNPEPQQDAHLRRLSCSILRLVIGRHWEWHYSTVFQSSCHFSHNVSALITQLSIESCSSRVKTALELKAQVSVSEDESLNTSISRHMLLCWVACGSLFTIVMTLI